MTFGATVRWRSNPAATKIQWDIFGLKIFFLDLPRKFHHIRPTFVPIPWPQAHVPHQQLRPTLWIFVKLPRHHILPKSWHISMLSLLGYPKFVPKTRPGRHKAVALLAPAWQVRAGHEKNHSQSCRNYRCHTKTSLKIIKHHQKHHETSLKIHHFFFGTPEVATS